MVEKRREILLEKLQKQKKFWNKKTPKANKKITKKLKRKLYFQYTYRQHLNIY